MIRLPFGWKLFFHLKKAPYIVEEYWAETADESQQIRDALTVKYDGQSDMHVRCQFFIENVQDRIVVFQYD